MGALSWEWFDLCGLQYKTKPPDRAGWLLRAGRVLNPHVADNVRLLREVGCSSVSFDRS